MKVVLSKSPRTEKKFRVVLSDGRHVDFGQAGYSDFTIHKDPKRMRLYLARHSRMGETWGIRGVATAGFWARWLLWSKPSIREAKRLIADKFKLNVRD